MAVTNLSVTDEYDALYTTTLKNYKKTLADNIFRQLPLLYWLNEGGRKRFYDGGLKIVTPLLYGENTTVKLYSGYELLDVTPQEGITAAEWNWKSLAGAISISREEERKNSGPNRRIALLEAKIRQCELSMQWYLNDLLHGRFSSHGKTFTGGDSNTVDSVGGCVVHPSKASIANRARSLY